MINQIILDALVAGLETTVYIKKDPNHAAHKMVTFKMDGFYKSSSVELCVNSYGEMTAYARYDEVTEINSFEDLVRLNFKWWNDSKYRADHWSEPGEIWGELFIKYGLATSQTETKTITKWSTK